MPKPLPCPASVSVTELCDLPARHEADCVEAPGLEHGAGLLPGLGGRVVAPDVVVEVLVAVLATCGQWAVVRLRAELELPIM